MEQEEEGMEEKESDSKSNITDRAADLKEYGINLEGLGEVSPYFAQIKKKTSPFETEPPTRPLHPGYIFLFPLTTFVLKPAEHH